MSPTLPSGLQRLAIAPEQIVHSQIHLTPEQQHYLKRVLRLGVGDRFIVMNGRGQAWLAGLSYSFASAQLLEEIFTQTELPIPVVLLVAMPKGSGMDEVVRQGTELGVAEIVPVVSDRTLLQPSPQKLERWRRIAQEAAEQSERQRVPLVHSPQPLVAALTVWKSEGSGCYFCAERRESRHLLEQVLGNRQAERLVVVTGAEGGWTEAEVSGAIALGYQPVTLGRRILRAVTAPLAALSLLAAAQEMQIHPPQLENR